MDLALLDLDDTLLAGDSDYLWGRYLCDVGGVERARFEARNQAFYADYQAGRLDVGAYLRFALRPLADNDLSTLLEWRRRFVAEKIVPIIAPQARALIERHHQRGDLAVIATSTNAFVAEPIARLLGADDLIATQPEIAGARFSGRVRGAPCFREGKLQCVRRWLARQRPAYRHSWCYSDSINDLALLEWADKPVVVDGDEKLRAHAARHGWPSLSLRGGEEELGVIAELYALTPALSQRERGN